MSSSSYKSPHPPSSTNQSTTMTQTETKRSGFSPYCLSIHHAPPPTTAMMGGSANIVLVPPTISDAMQQQLPFRRRKSSSGGDASSTAHHHHARLRDLQEKFGLHNDALHIVAVMGLRSGGVARNMTPSSPYRSAISGMGPLKSPDSEAENSRRTGPEVCLETGTSTAGTTRNHTLALSACPITVAVLPNNQSGGQHRTTDSDATKGSSACTMESPTKQSSPAVNRTALSSPSSAARQPLRDAIVQISSGWDHEKFRNFGAEAYALLVELVENTNPSPVGTLVEEQPFQHQALPSPRHGWFKRGSSINSLSSTCPVPQQPFPPFPRVGSSPKLVVGEKKGSPKKGEQTIVEFESCSNTAVSGPSDSNNSAGLPATFSLPEKPKERALLEVVSNAAGEGGGGAPTNQITVVPQQQTLTLLGSLQALTQGSTSDPLVGLRRLSNEDLLVAAQYHASSMVDGHSAMIAAQDRTSADCSPDSIDSALIFDKANKSPVFPSNQSQQNNTAVTSISAGANGGNVVPIISLQPVAAEFDEVVSAEHSRTEEYPSRPSVAVAYDQGKLQQPAAVLEKGPSPNASASPEQQTQRGPTTITKTAVIMSDDCGFSTLNDQYILGRRIGRGSYGEVLLGTKIATGEKVAIKKIKRGRIFAAFPSNATSLAPSPIPQIKGRGAQPPGFVTASPVQPEKSKPVWNTPHTGEHKLPTPFQTGGGGGNTVDVAGLGLDRNILREVAIMRKIKCKYIVQLYEAILDPTNQHVYLVMQFIDGGPVLRPFVDEGNKLTTGPSASTDHGTEGLAQYNCDSVSQSSSPNVTNLAAGAHLRPLNKVTAQALRYEALPEIRAISYVRKIVEGLAYMHQKGIVHRDVKPENILITKNGDSLYIADFGVSDICRGDAICVMDELEASRGPPPTDDERRNERLHVVGTPCFIAPESYQKGIHGKPVDIWALGVTLFAMVTGRLPFVGSTKEEIQHKVMVEDPDIPSTLHPATQRLLRAMLQKDPERRITTDQLKKSADLLVSTYDEKVQFQVPQVGTLSSKVSQVSGPARTTTAAPAEFQSKKIQDWTESVQSVPISPNKLQQQPEGGQEEHQKVPPPNQDPTSPNRAVRRVSGPSSKPLTLSGDLFLGSPLEESLSRSIESCMLSPTGQILVSEMELESALTIMKPPVLTLPL